VIDSRVTNEADWLGMSGAHPWHLDDETESVLFLTNAGDQECPIGFLVQAGGVHTALVRNAKMEILAESHPPKTHQTVHPRTPTETVAWAPCPNIP
jgi:hypothetical protein